LTPVPEALFPAPDPEDAPEVDELDIFLTGLFPIFQPHPLNVLTTFGVMAAVKGTLRKIKLL
jgi:hypothetical protein